MATKKDTTYPLRLRKDDDKRIVEFLNSQSGGYGDVIRYLIEKEIALNGIRDLSSIIPAKRNIDTLATTLKDSANINITKGIENKEVAIAEESNIVIDSEQKVNKTKEEVKATQEEVLNKNNEEIIEDKNNKNKRVKNIIKEELNEKQKDLKFDEDDIPDCYK